MRPVGRVCLLLLIAGLPVPALAEAAAEAPGQQSYPSLKLGGFTDASFEAIEPEGGETDSTFEQGQFVLHFTSALAPRVSFFSEVTLTASGPQYRASVERAIVRFDYSDRLKLSFGKYHTPINWWNTAFHHGLWLQTTVARPEMTQFGGKFIPVHFIGGLVEGSIPAGGLNLNYKAGLGNGRSESVSGAGDSGDANDNRARLVVLFLRPDRVYRLQVGGAWYRDRITLADAREFRESIVSAHVVWNGETPELIAEFAREDHRDLATGQRHRSDAFYVQLAYRLPVWGQRLKPYARFEKIDVAAIDPVLDGVPERERSLAGLRIDPTGFVAFKAEYRMDRIALAPDEDSVALQVSLAF